MSISPETVRKSPVKLTYDQYVLFPNDGNRHEIIDGRHYMNAAPNPRHQAVSRHIQYQLYDQIELKGFGEVINAPIDLQFSDCDVVQPDIVVVLKANRIITPTKIKGIPDLVIEILSPSNRSHDLNLKRRLYEQAQVPEYWIVDPDEQAVHRYLLMPNGTYAEPTTLKESISFAGTFGSALVDLTRVW
jgi:Uma2 family endonuclease